MRCRKRDGVVGEPPRFFARLSTTSGAPNPWTKSCAVWPMRRSFAMMLRYSFDLAEEAGLVEAAVRRAVTAGVRTADILQQGTAPVSTRVMGDTILRELEKAA